MKASRVRRFVIAVTLLTGTGLAGFGALQARSESWITLAPMPAPRVGAAGGVIDGRLHIVGGQASPPPLFPVPGLDKHHVYDPWTDTWTDKAAPAARRAYAAAGVIGRKLYVTGGCVEADCRVGTTAALEAYDPDTNTWTALAPMPTARSSAAAAVIDGKLYVAGGYAACIPCALPRSVEVYDPVTNTWDTAGSPMLLGQAEAAGAGVNGKFYVVGGTDSASGSVTATVQVYDVATDVWTFAAPLSVARRPETAVLNGRIFALGGAGTSTVLAIVESYDPVADVWSAEPAMPTARGAGVAAELHGRVHVVSGAVNFSAEITGAHEAFPSHVQLPPAPPPAPPPPPPPPPPTLVSISVSPSSATLSQGQTRTFQAIGHYSDGSTRILPSGSGGGGGGNTAPSGPLWSTQFSPQIDVTACGSGQLISFESQVFADANGVVDETWTAMTPLVNVDGSITASAVSLTLACANGAAAGTLSAQWTGTRYEGTFSFNGAWGTVSITGWSRQTPMPESRFSLAAASVDGIVYTFGGGNPSLPSTVYAYTPSTNAWAPAGLMETPREGAGAAAVNGLIYVIGGHVSGGIASGVTEAYDPASQAWITGLTPMPTPRAHLAVVTDGVYVYALGGDTTGSNGGIVAVVERYDPAANTWLTLEPMPSPGSFFAGGVLGGRIVVAGAGANGGISSAVHLYDIAANTWSAGPSMPGGRSMMAAAVANGGLYVVGGNGPSAHETWVYVPATAQRPAGWARAGSILTSRSQLAAAVVGDVVYAIGGMVPGSNPAETFAANEALSTHAADLYMPSSGPAGGGGSSSLPSVQWQSSDGSVASVNGSGTAHANMPGHTTIIATASNGMSCTASSTCASLTVTDNQPPVIEEVTPSHASLWPPNHQMVPITIAVSVSDNADPAPACAIAGVGSNEPVDGPGDGDTTPDWEVTGALSLRLRAERAGNGSGRIYTIAIRCVDRAGNGSVSGTKVYVAHSLRK